MYQVIIIGGGLAGLLNAFLLKKAGISCLIIEKKSYPSHKVCGEYVSNEVRGFLQSVGLYPERFRPPQINRLQISSERGATRELPLPMGGFGISRYQLEHFWYQKLVAAGVDFELNTSVSKISFGNETHQIATSNGSIFQAPIVIGAYGKRGQLDRQFNRKFMEERSPYFAVKYHIAYPWDPELIGLHLFENGYCGISMIEEQKVNLCYLGHRKNLKTHQNIDRFEKHVLSENPSLKKILSQSERLFNKPLVINEISFERKRSVVDHVLMSGDSAGLITPLCGNGMAMAIHSALLLVPKILKFLDDLNYHREQLEQDYAREWHQNFSNRLRMGRLLQRALFNKTLQHFLIKLSRNPQVADWIVRNTHGKELTNLSS